MLMKLFASIVLSGAMVVSGHAVYTAAGGTGCCFLGSPCCVETNCCSPGSECCFPGSPCCEASSCCNGSTESSESTPSCCQR
jgi:hypothetical protein